MLYLDGYNKKIVNTGYRFRTGEVCPNHSANRSYTSNGYWLPVILWLFTPAVSLAVELDMFRLTEVEGSLEIGYSVEDLEIMRVDGPTTTQRRPISTQELTLNTHGYIYHPNLLDMELGAGIRFQEDKFETDTGSNESKQTLYSFNGSFNVLKHKPYPLHLYFNQRNPTLSVGLADTFSSESKVYGLIFSLKRPFVSFPLVLRADHMENKGTGRGTLIDDETDYLRLDIAADNSDNISANLGVNHARKKSASGSVNLPLQATLREELGIDISTGVVFGENRKNNFENLFTYNVIDHDNLDTRKEGRFYSSLELEHDELFESFYRYNIESTSYTHSEDESNIEKLSLGFVRDLTESLIVSGGLDISEEENRGFNKDTYGVNSHLRYTTDLSEQTSFNTTYSLAYTHNKQKSELLQISRIGENHLFDGLQPVLLQNEFVVPGSVTVSNVARTQIYIEDIDYRLTLVGVETRLERLLSGNIPDGETVTVDYSYETGGSFEYGLFRQSLGLGYSISKTYHFRLGYTKHEETLEAGRPLRPLYSRERAIASADARHRISQTLGLNWHLELEKETGKLRPFMREAADINFTFTLPFLSSLAVLRSRYEKIDNELSEEDVNLTRHSLSIFARLGYRSRARLDYTIEKDTGGTIPRESRQASMEYLWRWRLLSLSLEGKYNLEEQGGVSRKDSSINLTLIRKI
ncbi:MAG: hypothetical protein AB2792_16540 [Candidatus Thiodiazotropha sp.]